MTPQRKLSLPDKGADGADGADGEEDGLARMERAAQVQECDEKAAKALGLAACKLVLGRDAKACFFATLALRLKREADWSLPTLATDGKILAYNPEYVANLRQDEIIGVLAHEVMHNALKHHARTEGRCPKRWNIACDLAINPLLRDAGFALPQGGLFPGEGDYRRLKPGLSAEEYYGSLQEDREDREDQGQQEGDGEEGQAGDDPGKCGGVRKPGDGSQAAARESEAEWDVAIAQAHNEAKKRGALPASLARLVEQALSPKVDWKEVLREFISRIARNDYAWFPPNRRFVHLGLYLPGLRSEELGDVVVAVDTSGSISPRVLDTFAGELQGILESYEVSLTVLYHDAVIQHVQRWKSTDGPLVLEPKGGGGTSHVCVTDWIESQGDQPACLVCLTDLCTQFPAREPHYPVLWAVVGNGQPRAPFGAIVPVS